MCSLFCTQITILMRVVILITTLIYDNMEKIVIYIGDKNMIYWILMIVLAIVATILIVDIKKDFKRNIMILLSLIYDFIIGFFSWIIYFIIMIFLLKIFKDIINIYLCYILSEIIFVIFFLILLVPTSIKIKKKAEINTIKYIVISILIIILGMITFFVFSNINL